MESQKIFEILMREHAPMLLTYIRSVVGAPLAVDEVFQETMITAWEKLDDFDEHRKFGPWLRGIAKNHALSHFRKSKRDMLMCNEEILSYLDDQLGQVEAQPGDSWGEKIHALHQCIDALPEIYHEVVSMRYLRELKTAELNSHVAASKETIKKRLQRAKNHLLLCMQGKGFFVVYSEVRSEQQ